MHSEEEFDQDTKPMDEKDSEDEEASQHLIKAFGSTINKDIRRKYRKSLINKAYLLEIGKIKD